MIQLPPKQYEKPFKSQHSFTSVIRAEEYWVDQSRRNVGQFMNYMTGGERPPAKHHLEWLYHIINPTDKRVLIVASREFAKALPLDSNVLTPSGWVKMNDVKVGSSVIGKNGEATTVVGVYPQGEQDVYKITFTDGSVAECTDDHLWTVRLIGGSKGYRTVTLNEIRTKRWNNKEKRYTSYSNDKSWLDYRGYPRYHIPIVEPIQFNSVELPMDAYTMGVLLGDGGLTQSIMISCADKEILERVREALPSSLVMKHKANYDYSIVKKEGRNLKSENSYLTTIKQIGLFGKCSNEKFIPNEYLFASLEDRIALLQGLLDTDGSIPTKRGKNGIISFCTTSEKLADDVRSLVNSLGGTSTKTKSKNSYKYKDEVKSALDYYRLTIKLPEGIEPFYLSRKAKYYRPYEIYTPTRGIVNIEYIGKKECQCIKVDSDDGLFVTNDFVVTHNTHVCVYSMAWFIGNNPKLTNAIVSVAAKQAKERMEMLRDIMALPRYKNVFPWIHIDGSKPDTQIEFTLWSEKWNPTDPHTIPYNTYRSLLTTHYDSKMPTMKIAGLGSSELIGSRFSGLALCDDPHDEKNSNTEDLRQKVVREFKTNILNCMQASGKVVVITTRWAETDLAAHLMDARTLKGEPVWKVIETPAINKEGNSNWPGVWPLERLQAKREEVGELMFQTQYMNNPLGASSGMFEMKHLTQDLPDDLDIKDFDKVIVSTDMASTKTAGSDWTVIAVIARDKRKPFRMFVLDMLRVKVNFDEGLLTIAKFCDEAFEKYGKLDGVLFEVPASRANAEELRNRRLDLPVIEVQTKGDKALRLGAVAVKAQGKNLYINQKIPCLQALFSEMIGFPKAAHDDIPDCLSLPLQLTGWNTGTGAGVKIITAPVLL